MSQKSKIINGVSKANRSALWLCTVVLVALCFGVVAHAGPLKALIVNGQMNASHDWNVSSPVLKQILEQTGLFKVDFATSPAPPRGGTSPPRGGDMENFKPNFAAYDVVVLDYDGQYWSEQTKSAFVKYVKNGGGIVVYHSANNAFPDWKEFNEITGLGGWGGRDEKSGPYIRWRDGKIIRDVSPGRGGSHPPQHAFQVIIRNKEHPITKGLPEKWMHARDELYSELRGPAKNLTVLATAYADPNKGGTGEHEPVLFTVNYGEGRVFHTVFGHAKRPPLPCMECVGFIVTLQRGAEWAASGKVTQKVPEDFPTATEVRRWNGYKPRPASAGASLSPRGRGLDELLVEVKTYDFGQSRLALTAVSDRIHEAYGKPAELMQIEESLLELLQWDPILQNKCKMGTQSDATYAGKQFVCRQLSVIGTDQSVPILSEMLTKLSAYAGTSLPLRKQGFSDMARYALERIPGMAVEEALRKALLRTKGKTKVGIINSLGERHDSKAVPALSELVYDSNGTIAAAAVSALGKIADPQAIEALAKAKDEFGARDPGHGARILMLVLDAYLKCADQLAAQGKKAEALAIYRQLYEQDQPKLIRTAAMQGIVNASARTGRKEYQEAIDMVIDALKSGDPQMQTGAIVLAREIPGKEVTEAIIRELPNLSVTGQIQLLSALADRGDRIALPAVVEAANAKETSIRLAALKALGQLGDASSVILLAQTAANGSAELQEAARESLYRLRGAKIDEAILANILSAEPKVKVELIRSIGERNIVAGVQTLLKTAQDPDGRVQRDSFKVLKAVADEKYLPTLVELLINVPSESVRSEAEETVVAVARKIDDKDRQADAVLAVLRVPKRKKDMRLGSLPSVKDTKSRCSLLSVLGRIGSDSALPVLRTALKDKDGKVKDTAIRALSGWPNPAPVEDLLRVAQSSDDQTRRILALRGLVRLLGLDSNRPPKQLVEMYRLAIDLAPNAEEKKTVLSSLANAKSVDALQMAADYMEDDTLYLEAQFAAITIAEGIYRSFPQQTKEVLKTVIRMSENELSRQRAQKVIDRIEALQAEVEK